MTETGSVRWGTALMGFVMAGLGAAWLVREATGSDIEPVWLLGGGLVAAGLAAMASGIPGRNGRAREPKTVGPRPADAGDEAAR